MNVYIVTTPYHVLLSCYRCKEGDYIICAGQFQIDGTVRQMINKTFGFEHCVVVDSFQEYKTRPIMLFSFRCKIKHSLRLLIKICFNEIVIFNDVDPVVQYCLSTLESDNCVLIEEGIGLYRDTVRRNNLFFKLFGKVFFGLQYENISRIGESNYVTQIECFYTDCLSSKQRVKKVKQLEPVSYDNIGSITFSVGCL